MNFEPCNFTETRKPLPPFGLRRRRAVCFVADSSWMNNIDLLTTPRIRHFGARNAAHGTFTTGF